MQTATKQLWASALAAIVGSLCCVAPLVLITLGIWLRLSPSHGMPRYS